MLAKWHRRRRHDRPDDQSREVVQRVALDLQSETIRSLRGIDPETKASGQSIPSNAEPPLKVMTRELNSEGRAFEDVSKKKKFSQGYFQQISSECTYETVTLAQSPGAVLGRLKMTFFGLNFSMKRM